MLSYVVVLHIFTHIRWVDAIAVYIKELVLKKVKISEANALSFIVVPAFDGV